MAEIDWYEFLKSEFPNCAKAYGNHSGYKSDITGKDLEKWVNGFGIFLNEPWEHPDENTNFCVRVEIEDQLKAHLGFMEQMFKNGYRYGKEHRDKGYSCWYNEREKFGALA